MPLRKTGTVWKKPQAPSPEHVPVLQTITGGSDFFHSLLGPPSSGKGTSPSPFLAHKGKGKCLLQGVLTASLLLHDYRLTWKQIVQLERRVVTGIEALVGETKTQGFLNQQHSQRWKGLAGFGAATTRSWGSN